MGEYLMLNVIYEDNHIIVVEKPCNVPSQADKTTDEDMLTLVKSYIKEKYQKPGEVYLGLVHRLDRPVGGIMVFARTSKGASRLSEAIRTNNFSKKYLAVVNGTFDNKTGSFEDYLFKDEALNKSKVVSKDKKGAKLAKLSYEVIGEANGNSLVKINLETGRHHQIRVQFSNAGHALVGDQKYGKSNPGVQIALWAYELEFKHPTKDEIMKFNCYPKKVGPWAEFEY
ncbi:MAG: RluA family pseudouridine synthase [Clostridia bacterium]|nr:RluA family pseudouridine synthase [Clostridia bacterium]